jgi:mRNA interferase MazF
MDMVIKRYTVFNIDLDPAKGVEIQKVRPCLVVSPDVMNKFLSTVIIVPLTTTIRSYPTRLNIAFKGKQGQLAIDQIRTVDKSRLLKKIGEITDKSIVAQLQKILSDMFCD